MNTIIDWLSENNPQYVWTVWDWKKSIFFTVVEPGKDKFRHQQTLIREINLMAKEVKNGSKRRGTQESVPVNVKSTKWVNCDVRNADDKKAIAEFIKDTDGILDSLVVIVDDGHDILLKRGDNDKGAKAMLFCNTADHPHRGLALSANGVDAYVALAVLVYKYQVKLGGSLIDTGEDNEYDFG